MLSRKFTQKAFSPVTGITSNLPAFMFGSFTQRTIIRPEQKPFIPYTREQLKLMKENPNYEREILENRLQAQTQQVEDLHFNNFSNDQNPNNFLDLIVDDETDSYNPVFDQITAKQTQIPLWIEHTRPAENKSIAGTYGSIKGSVKKLKPTVDLILKKHLYDAMSEMEACHKMAAEPIFRALNMVRNHALGVGLNQDHLWVKGAELQKQKRRKSIYYHSMGKSGIMKRDWSRVKITLEEKPVDEIFRMVISGNAPPGMAKLWRDRFEKENADFDTIRKFQFILTSKGRSQRKLMIKRKAQRLQDQFLVSSTLLYSKFNSLHRPKERLLISPLFRI